MNFEIDYSDHVAELRIIAKDEKRLTLLDQSCLVKAADELETIRESIILMNAELYETKQKLAASNDRLKCANRMLSNAGVQKYPELPSMHMSTGPIPMVFRTISEALR